MFENLLEKAETALTKGEFDEALDLLRQAHDIQPDNPELANCYSKLGQRRSLEEQLNKVEFEYCSTLRSGSKDNAYRTLSSGLQLILEYLPSNSRQTLIHLLQLDGTSPRDAAWETATDLLSELNRTGIEDWASRWAYELARPWVPLSHERALIGWVTSTIEQGYSLTALLTAIDGLARYPTNNELIMIAARARGKLVEQVHGRALIRLAEAEYAIQAEEYQSAIKYLLEIDQVVYREVEAVLPGFFGDDPEAERIRREANELADAADGLQLIKTTAQTKLREAESFFISGQFAEAEGKLREIEDVPLSSLAGQVRDLMTQVRRARVEKAHQELHRETINIQTSLDTFNSQELSAALNHLQTLPAKIDWQFLIDEDRREYKYFLDQIFRRLQYLSLFEQAQNYANAGDYAKASALLSSIPREGNPEAQALFAQIEQEKEKQRREKLEEFAQKLLERAKDEFYDRRFLTARRTLDEVDNVLAQTPKEHKILWEVQAHNLRDDIEDASKIWALYSQAQMYVWEGQKEGGSSNLREANALLDRAVEFLPRNEVAREIQVQARELMDSILMGVYMMEGNLDAVEKRLIAKMMVEPTNVRIRLNLIQVRATKDIGEFTRQIKTESRLWFWATMTATIIAFVIFVIAVMFALRDNTIFASLTLLVTVLTGFLAKGFSDQYQRANQRVDEKLENKLEDFIKQQVDEVEKIGGTQTVA